MKWIELIVAFLQGIGNFALPDEVKKQKWESRKPLFKFKKWRKLQRKKRRWNKRNKDNKY